MKKLLAILMTLALSISMLACDKEDNRADTNDKNAPQKNDILHGVTLEKTVLYDENDIKITVLGLTVDKNEPALQFEITNNQSKDIEVRLYFASVNNIMDQYYRAWSYSYSDAGKANTTKIWNFNLLDNLEKFDKFADIEIIQSIQFDFRIDEAESGKNLFWSDLITLTTSADPSYVQKYDDNGAVVYEDENLRIVYLGLRKAKYGYDEILFFCENKSNHQWLIEVKEDTYRINGHDNISNGFSFLVLPHHIAYDYDSIDEDVFTQFDFDKLETIELVFEISTFGSSEYNHEYTTPTITVPLS